MTTLAADRAERIARKAEHGLTIAVVLGIIEIVRRSPRWLLLIAGLLAYVFVLVALAYFWWIVAAAAAIASWKLRRGFVYGWQETR